MTDDRMEGIIGNLLRLGVMLAAAVVFAGGIWYVAANASEPVSYGHFQPDPPSLRSIGSMGKPEALMLIGLLILIATPVARVAFSLAAFALEGDRMYVGMTAIVLAVLLYSIGTAWW